MSENKESVWKSGRPWVIGKAAMSLDGKMTRPPGEGQWISGEASRQDVQKLRAACDGILVGAETARVDNPKLTVRSIELEVQPFRIVVTRSQNLPEGLHLLTDVFKDRTLVLSNCSWPEIWSQLFERGVRTLLVEGGGSILNQLAAENWIDESVIYYAPFNLEGDSLVTAEVFRKLPLTQSTTLVIGEDLKISGPVKK
ncbi:MAG: RibD family protein [Verrucomicrobiota bacterium]